jgi:acyl carrier protein
MNSIETEIVEIVSAIAKTPAADIGLDTDLRLDLNVDSLQGLQIMAAIERRFGIDVPDDDLDQYTSVGVIAETVARLARRPIGSSSRTM